jgi:hypothetical protein
VAVLSLSLLAVASAVMAVLSRDSPALEWARRIALGVVVADAAIGLAVAVRGGAPSEWIHWVYAVVIGLVLLAPGALRDVGPRARSGSLALCSAIAAAMAWRLWGSG